MKILELQNNNVLENPFTAFGSTYICDQTFSILKFRKNKYCSRLSDEHVDAVLRISTSNMKADINELAGKIQPRKSHLHLNLMSIFFN